MADYTPNYWDDFIAESVDYYDVDALIQLIDYKDFPFIKLLDKIGAGSINTTTHHWGYETPDINYTAISAFDVDGDGTGIQFASTAGMFPGDLLQALGQSRQSEQVRIVTVDSATEITVTRDANGSTGVTYVVGDRLYNVGKQHPEGDAASREYYIPDTLNNTIFANSALVTRSLIAIKSATRFNERDWEDHKVLNEFKRDFERNAFWGQAHAATSAAPYWSADGLYEWVDWANTADSAMDHIVEVAGSAFKESTWREHCRNVHTYGKSQDKWTFCGQDFYERVYLLYKDRHMITTNTFLDYEVHRVPTYQGDFINLVEHRMFDGDLDGWGFTVDPAYVQRENYYPYITWPVNFLSHGVTQKGMMVFGAKGLKVRNPYTLHLLKIT